MDTEINSKDAYSYKIKCALRVTGEDVAYFLQSQFSNDLSDLRIGKNKYGLWLDVKGHVIADSNIYYESINSYIILCKSLNPNKIQSMLESHIIADDVHIESLKTHNAISLDPIMATKFLSLFNKGGLLESDLGCFEENNFLCYHGENLKEGSVDFCFFSKTSYDKCLSFFNDFNLNWLSVNEFNIKRILRGILLVPEELGANDLPGEADLVPEVVSISKGCYLGQESVSRLYNLGRKRRSFFVAYIKSTIQENNLKCPISIKYKDIFIGEIRSLYAKSAKKDLFVGVIVLKIKYLTLFEKSYKFDHFEIENVISIDKNRK